MNDVRTSQKYIVGSCDNVVAQLFMTEIIIFTIIHDCHCNTSCGNYTTADVVIITYGGHDMTCVIFMTLCHLLADIEQGTTSRFALV